MAEADQTIDRLDPREMPDRTICIPWLEGPRHPMGGSDIERTRAISIFHRGFTPSDLVAARQPTLRADAFKAAARALDSDRLSRTFLFPSARLFWRAQPDSARGESQTGAQ